MLDISICIRQVMRQILDSFLRIMKVHGSARVTHMVSQLFKAVSKLSLKSSSIVMPVIGASSQPHSG